ncbi:MAG: sigma-70 family RNA polymerase sigma factor [Propionibacteriaceae bacterium]|jgi:RNA polymerase sigma factor (sigma-70 family)|nr:sigma-70 family RNA polymerase sigma factor [Propionibacteriaceae bacterium]
MISDERDREIRLAKQVEAGLLAQDLLDNGAWSDVASAEELHTLVELGYRAKDELFMDHLGLVAIIAAEAARTKRVSYSDLYQEGCVAMQQALRSYDWQKGPFGAYAGMWIRATVRRATDRASASLDEVDPQDVAMATQYDRSLTTAGLAQVLATIPDTERQVVQLRVGWSGVPKSLQAVAQELGITVSRVRRLERDGLRAIRREWELADAA